MKKNIVIDDNFYLISQEVNSDTKKTTVSKSTNHIFVVDVSYSMYYDLPLIKKQLKNKLSDIMREGDTITIIWFSGKNDAGVLKEEVEVKSLKTLTDLHSAIDKWLNPIGLTAFLKPLDLTKDVISRIKNNRPDSVFSLIFLTDGYNNDCPWNDVISTLKSLENDISSSTFVEYGYYADTRRLTEMASLMGGEKVSTSDFEEFEPVFDKKISTGSLSTKKTVIKIEDKLKYNFAYSIENGNVLLYNINEDNEILIGNNIDKIFYFSEDGDDGISIFKDFDIALYAGIYVLSDKLMNFEAEKLFYSLGDNFYYKELLNSFGKQKLNSFKNSIKKCVEDKDSRFPEGKSEILPVPDDAYCLMNLIKDLSNLDYCNFCPDHESFEYNRIGRKMEMKGSSLSEKEQKQLAEAKNVEEANKILEDFKDKNIDLKFVPTTPKDGYPVKDFVWNEDRANLSIRVKTNGIVELPENKFGIDSVDSYKYNTYTIIKDGIVNVKLLPVTWSEELDDLLMEKGVGFNRSTLYDSNDNITKRYILIHLNSIPIINRKMVKDISANELAKLEWELIKLKGESKTYTYYRNQHSPKESKSYTDMLGQEAADWLKEIGITDYNGFAPKRVSSDTHDSYMAVLLATKIKGLSSLPKVNDVEKKIDDNKELKLSEWVLSKPIKEYKSNIDGDLFKSLNDDTQKQVLEDFFIKKQAETISKKRKVMQEISQIKFSLILSKRWFKEFKSFDENKLDLKLDDKDVSFTFDLSEKEIKI